ncbi:SH3 domain-containing protein [Bacillus sp. sid0103]|uniref:SH3 domain-containing protein n=1 Tax=Bacillus sp. sid0103 TaxID=2856337 RepID=UPI001C4410D4|nr:SH3 domain-containing protein [Bacillus sp. sid0103]MBV7505719.1 SH3 domain-containing protein [Bacillus sp. sid0103]
MNNMGKVMVLSTGLILGGLSSGATIPLAPISIEQAEAASLVVISKTTFQTTANLRLREGAGTTYKTIITIPKGKVITATEKKGSYYKVSYSYTSKGKTYKKSGWVSGSYVKEYYKYINTSGTYYFTKKTGMLYTTPDTKKKSVGSLPNGNGLYSTQKVVNSIGKTWYRVQYKGKYLYIYSGDVYKSSSKSLANKEYQTIKDTYVFSSYGPSYTKLILIPKGTAISSLKMIGNWYEVSYKGKKGYVYKEYMQPKSTSTATENPSVTNNGSNYLVLDDVNMRKSGEGSAVLAVIPNGRSVKSTGKKLGDWYQVIYNDKTGYVYKSYLKEYKLTDYRFIDLRTKSTVTAKQINDYIAKNTNGKPSVLVNKGQAFIDAGIKYGINALYLAAHAIHESGFGTSNISLGKKNLFGYGAYDAAPFVGAYRFSTVEQCINYVAQKMKADYLNPNGTHFEGAMLGYRTNDSTGKRVASKSIGMNYWYASDPNWGNGIARHMQNILPFDQKYYDKASINTTVPALPGIPAGKDIFPAGIQAKAKKDLSSTIKKDTTFILLEKSNDYNLKVNVNTKDTTIKVAFSTYDDYFTVLNLGRVSGSSYLNVRPEPSTAKKEIAQLYLNDYVQLVLDSKGIIVMDKTKTWYNIKLSTGKTGWVSKNYIVRELK